MERITLKYLPFLNISHGDGFSHGCDQEWYPVKWHRMAGCGPSVASNLFYYLSRTETPWDERICTKDEFLPLMEELWRYVTPNMKGVSTTGRFVKGAAKYAGEKGLSVSFSALDIPSSKVKRPPLGDVVGFVREALSADTPAAFLNLNNGSQLHLDSWHWVTVVSMEWNPDGSVANATIYDSGEEKTVDLAAWLITTRRGGGFVRIHRGAAAE